MMNTNKYFILLFLILNNFVFGIKEIKLNTPNLESKTCIPHKDRKGAWERYAMTKELIIKPTPQVNTYHIILQHKNGHREIIGKAFDKKSANKSIELTWFAKYINGKATLRYEEKK